MREYNEPVIEIIQFTSEDVITNSNDDLEPDDPYSNG